MNHHVSHHACSFSLAITLVIGAGASAISAQGETAPARPSLGPSSFFPKEYTQEYFIDLDALQDTDIWDAIERSPIAGPMFMKFRQEFGFRIRGILSVRAGGNYIADENAPNGQREVTVTVLQGKKLSLPGTTEDKPNDWMQRTRERINGFDVVREVPSRDFTSGPRPRLYVMPKPDLLVIGQEDMVRPILEGKRRGGVISSRLMALTAARRPLAYVAIEAPQPGDPRYNHGSPFDTNWLSEDDPLQHFIVRLTFDAPTAKTMIKMTMRFKTGKKGPKLLEESMKASLEEQKIQPFYQLVKGIFDKLQWRRDGVDLHVLLSLERKELSNLFGMTGIVPWFLMSVPAAAAPMPPAPVRAAAGREDKPIPKKAAPKKAAPKKAAPKKSPTRTKKN